MSQHSNVFTALSKKAAKKAAPLPAVPVPLPPKKMFPFASAGNATTSWGDDEETEEITSLSIPQIVLPEQSAVEEEDDEEESESESEEEEEDEEVSKPIIVAPTAPTVAVPVRSLSKKEKKKLEMEELESALAELGLEGILYFISYILYVSVYSLYFYVVPTVDIEYLVINNRSLLGACKAKGNETSVAGGYGTEASSSKSKKKKNKKKANPEAVVAVANLKAGTFAQLFMRSCMHSHFI